MTGQEYQTMLDAIATPAELLRPESFLPAFQQPTPISRKSYLDIIYRRAVVLGMSDEDFEQAARAARISAGGDVFGRAEHTGKGGIIVPQLAPIGLSQIQTAAVEWLIPGLFPRGERPEPDSDGRR